MDKKAIIVRGLHTSAVVGNKFITPLKENVSSINLFGTMDIETINLYDIQTPVMITTCYGKLNKIFTIDYKLLMFNKELAVKKLWNEYFLFISTYHVPVIFAHNLGNFDGYFLYKALSGFTNPKNISSIIDAQNSFIQITFKMDNGLTINWRDSQRIFPISLNGLCKNFGIAGKISEYNVLFNSINIFKDKNLFPKFKQYALQDSVALFNALSTAQEIYITKYNVDITEVYSTSTLSLKIFRNKYLNVSIPILNSFVDNFIRAGYFGGGTDFYKAFAENLHYYDVNSLYPHVMCNQMPLKLIRYINDMSRISLNNFFGFCLAEITCDNNVFRPVLPYKHKG